MIRRILPLGGLVAVALALAPSAGAGQGGSMCVLNGNASFGTPLTLTAQDFTYSFSGSLDPCQGSHSDKTGTVSAGLPITIGGVQYEALGVPHGNGSCTNSTTSGTSFVDWGGGRYSVIDYDTKGAGALVALNGSFRRGSVTLVSVAKTQTGQPVTTTTVDLVYGGDYTGGPLTFQPADPTKCNTGLDSAKIQGALGHGNYS